MRPSTQGVKLTIPVDGALAVLDRTTQLKAWVNQVHHNALRHWSSTGGRLPMLRSGWNRRFRHAGYSLFPFVQIDLFAELKTLC